MIEGKKNINSSLKPYGRVKLELKGKDGRVKKTRTVNMESYVRNFWDIIWEGLTGGNSFNIPNIFGGSSFFRGYGGIYISGEGNAGADYRGLLIGSGNTPVALDDTTLDSRINHGTSAGQLEYGEAVINPGSDPYTIEVSRTFTNNSGGSIDVWELATAADEDGDTAVWIYARDVLDSAFTIPNGNALTATYEFGFTDGTRNVKMWTWSLIQHASHTYYSSNGGSHSDDYLYASRGGAEWSSGEVDRMGVVVGTGDTAFTKQDIDMDSIIPVGSGAGELTKQSHQITRNVNVSNGTYEIIVSCEFANNSGADITIREIGLFSTGPGGSPSYLINRIVLPNPTDIVAGTTRQARFVLSYSLS